MSVQLGHLTNNIDERSSTRLHAPPGGKQSFNIFGAAEPAPNPQYQQQGGRRAVPQQQAPPAQNQYQQQPAQTRVAADSVTGQRQSTRVHAAPGGKQSINIFGGDDSYNHYAKPTAQPQAQQQYQQSAPAQSAKPTERSTRPW